MHTREARQARKPFTIAIFAVLFGFSGAAALVYEVVWVRQFTDVLGASHYAVTIILASFMAGLGLGAWSIGRRVDALNEKQLIYLYAGLEIGIAGYALLLPTFLEAAQVVYAGFFHSLHPGTVGFNGIRLAISFLLLLLPSTFMGATLPVLSRYIVRRSEKISVTVAQLYAVNTAGAVCGAFAAGYILLPAWGIAGATYLAVAANLFVAFAFWGVACRIGATADGLFSRPPAPLRRAGRLSGMQITVLIGLGLCGSAAMFYEVAWTRTLSMIMGTTTFAFTTMLVTFLIGLTTGSALYSLVPRSIGRLKLFVVLQSAVAVFVLASIPLFELLPLIFLTLHRSLVDTWLDLQYIRFALSALVMLGPTMAMGMLFPVSAALLIDETGDLGSRLGKAYGANTLGNVLGAATGGLVLIPLIGMQKTIMAGAGLNLAVAGAVFLARGGRVSARRLAVAGAAGAAAVAIIAALPPWTTRVINSGVYIYAPQYETLLERYSRAADGMPEMSQPLSWDLWRMAMEQYGILYYKTGAAATVAVMERDDGVRFLTIDGKTDASTGAKSDMRTQVMIGQMPMLFNPEADKVLVVGLGSGVTVGSVLTHEPRMVDCAEISPEVIEAAQFFQDWNHNALEDPRLKIIPRDARNLLLTSEEKYDVVISQPSNPWISGESSLFALEFYELVKDRLSEGGLFLQWMPSYLMSTRDIKIIGHTLRSVFPHLTVWTSGSIGDLVFLAQKGDRLQIDYDRLIREVQLPGVAADIRRVGLDPVRLPFDLFVYDESDLAEFLYSDLSGPLPFNRDNRLVTEFSVPRQLVRRNRVDRFQDPGELHGDPAKLMNILTNVDPALMIEKLELSRFSRSPVNS